MGGSIARFLARRDKASLIGGGALCALYLIYYFVDGASPGFGAKAHLGWWGWFDQGRYLASAVALWHGDLAPANHWYALGYSLLAAPFTAVTSLHPFFIVDLAGLLIAYTAFMAVAGRLHVKASWAASVFVLTTMGDPRFGILWSQPWNTTVSAALIWTLFALMAAHLMSPPDEDTRTRTWRWGATGAVMAMLPLVRMADGVFVLMCAPVLIAAGLRMRTLRPRAFLVFTAAGLAVVIPYAVLYIAIYGMAPTPYMLHSAPVGFVPRELPWKAVILLLDPQPWFPEGVGLLTRCPWIAVSLAALPLVLVRLRGAERLMVGLLAAVMAVYVCIYMAYVDFLPSGFWRYHNIHYFKWLMPGLGLFAALAIARWPLASPRAALATLFITLLVLSLRIAAVPVADGVPARMVQFAGPTPPWADTYFNHSVLTDGEGRFENVYDMRVLPDAQGVRVVALARRFIGPLQWVALPPLGDAAAGAPKRWDEKVEIGFPCWLPPYPCERLAP